LFRKIFTASIAGESPRMSAKTPFLTISIIWSATGSPERRTAYPAAIPRRKTPTETAR